MADDLDFSAPAGPPKPAATPKPAAAAQAPLYIPAVARAFFESTGKEESVEAGTVCLNRIARARRDARFPSGQEERDDAMVERAFHRLRATSTPLVEDVRPMLRRFHLARAHYLPLVRALAGRLFVNVEAAAPRQEAAVYEGD